MATRNGDDEPRGAERKARGDDERPGVYVQVVGSPRKRKNSATKVSAEESSHSVERVGASAGRYQVERSVEEPSDDTQRMERPVERTFAAPRRAPGPLGMEDGPRQPPEPRYPSEPRSEPAAALKKTSLGLGPRMSPELLAETHAREQTRREARGRVETPAYHFEASLPPSAPQPSAPPLEYEPPSAASRVRVVEAPAPEPALSENTNHRADIVRAAPSAVVLHQEAAPAEQLPSLLDARPSIRPSDPVRSGQGPSWGMVVGVAVLSSIIASAGVVALQELFRPHGREVPHTLAASEDGNMGAARPAATKAVVTTPVPAAVVEKAPEVAPAAPAAPASPEPASAPPAMAAAEPPVAAMPAPSAEAAPAAAALTAPADQPVPAAKATRPLAARPQVRAAGPARASAAPAKPAKPGLSQSDASTGAKPAGRLGGGNRILSDGLVAPDRGAAAADEGAGAALPTNPYE